MKLTRRPAELLDNRWSHRIAVSSAMAGAAVETGGRVNGPRKLPGLELVTIRASDAASAGRLANGESAAQAQSQTRRHDDPNPQALASSIGLAVHVRPASRLDHYDKT
jgi:hypothetical protein